MLTLEEGDDNDEDADPETVLPERASRARDKVYASVSSTTTPEDRNMKKNLNHNIHALLYH
jgi:hypothetical protein